MLDSELLGDDAKGRHPPCGGRTGFWGDQNWGDRGVSIQRTYTRHNEYVNVPKRSSVLLIGERSGRISGVCCVIVRAV